MAATWGRVPRRGRGRSVSTGARRRYEQVFAKDRAALVDEIQGLERSAAARKIDDLVRRGRLALLHCRLCAVIRARYAPGLLKRLFVPRAAARAKQRCVAELDDVYATVLRKQPAGS